VNNVTEKLESIDNEEPNFSDLIEKLYKENFTNRDIIKILKSLGLKRNDAYKLIEDFKK
jgi:16S rRNA (cytidine1402-2'-O)-methyltransferase